MSITKIEQMAYKVGGYVRDTVMGLESSDVDYVVVGVSQTDMLNAGFKQVGRDFPVFLHPHTKDEYALARKEKSTGNRHSDFSFDLNATLHDDLMRRDLTINSIAIDYNGDYIDPHNGIDDIKNKIVRHTSSAFVEDPLRVLRAIRFAARFEFLIHDSLVTLIQRMVRRGALHHLTPERVFKELQLGLMLPNPSYYLKLMRDLGVMKIILPEVYNLFGVPQVEKYHPEICTGQHTLMSVQKAADKGLNFDARFAVMCHDLGKALTPDKELPSHKNHEERGLQLVADLCERLKVTKDTRMLSMNFCGNHTRFFYVDEMKAGSVISLFEDIGSIRHPHNLDVLLDMCICDKSGRGGDYPMRDYKPFKQVFVDMFAAIQELDTSSIADKYIGDGVKIKEMLHMERAKLVQPILKKYQKSIRK